MSESTAKKPVTAVKDEAETVVEETKARRFPKLSVTKRDAIVSGATAVVIGIVGIAVTMLKKNEDDEPEGTVISEI